MRRTLLKTEMLTIARHRNGLRIPELTYQLRSASHVVRNTGMDVLALLNPKAEHPPLCFPIVIAL